MTTNTASLEAGESSAAPVRVGEIVAEKYLIQQTLGVGGMGVVVAARDQLLDRRVAIKFLLPKLVGSETSVQRFVREARAATRITSEHVVRLLEIEKLPSGTPFFVMEYLEGSDLRALLRERGALLPSLAVDYVLQALQAVAEGHVRGIVHRDIKPSNLFLTRRADGTPLIKVLDFGIAKTVDGDDVESTSLTSSDDVRLGSPSYMPPEQLQNPRDVDKRSDIWSLGATLYELLCGRPPFEGPGYLELASRILSQPPTPLSQQELAQPLPRGLERVVRKCLEKDRKLRYANASELATALAPFGSEDARISLTRVSGLGATASFPPLSRAIPAHTESCEPTLDVVGEARTHLDDRRASNVGAPPPARNANRTWPLVLLTVCVLGVGLLFRGSLAGSGGKVATTAPTSAVSPVASTPAEGPLRTEPPLQRSAPHAVQADRGVARPADPSTSLVARTPASGGASGAAGQAPGPRAAGTRAHARPAAASGASSFALSAVPPEAAVSAGASESSPTSAPASPDSGRSDAIERLIEERR